MRHSYDEIDRMLRPLGPVLAREADVLLDLRDLLASQGHPGKCVRCFFHLFEAAGEESKPRLAPLKAWLEKHVEITVHGDGEELETLPFVPRRDEDLERFCQRSMEHIRMDRSYKAKEINLAFRYKRIAA